MPVSTGRELEVRRLVQSDWSNTIGQCSQYNRMREGAVLLLGDNAATARIERCRQESKAMKQQSKGPSVQDVLPCV